jgi:6-carboxyhexanoate--CoA ligase
MRASKNVRSRKAEGRSKKPSQCTQNPTTDEMHISGAEGLYELSDLKKITNEYISRAVHHPRGKPDSIVITIEKVKQKPKLIHSLPVSTLKCRSPSEANKFITKLLKAVGISEKAVGTAFSVLNSKKTMRGASLLLAEAGKRVEPDKKRGIRASRLGINRSADKALSNQLAKQGINNTIVKEAIILASKVAACKKMVAELCISDDPYYTTGYISSKQFGYVRIPNIKKWGNKNGGRVFFLEENADIDSAIKFIEKTPVIINNPSGSRGVYSINDILNRHHW